MKICESWLIFHCSKYVSKGQIYNIPMTVQTVSAFSPPNNPGRSKENRINEHPVVHDYRLCTMVKTLHDGQNITGWWLKCPYSPVIQSDMGILNQYLTTTKLNKAQTMYIFLAIYCISTLIQFTPPLAALTSMGSSHWSLQYMAASLTFECNFKHSLVFEVFRSSCGIAMCLTYWPWEIQKKSYVSNLWADFRD